MPLRGPGPTLTRELLERYLSGDRESEARLFEGHRDDLVRRVRSASWMSGLRGLVTPEDLVQEVFVRALSSGMLRDFEDRGRGSLARALAKVLDDVAVDTYRRHGTLKRGGGVPGLQARDEAAEEGEVAASSPARDATPTSNAREKEILELCRDVLEPREWQVWQLSEVEGLDSRAVAERLGATPAAVRGVLHRARKRILRRMADGLEREG